MSGKKEREAVYYYLSNLVNSPISKSKQSDVLEWVDANSAELFGIDLYTIWDDRGSKKYLPERKFKRFEKYDCDEPGKTLSRSIKTVRAILAQRDIVDITARGYNPFVDMIFDMFKIQPRHQAILLYMIYREMIPIMYSFDVHPAYMPQCPAAIMPFPRGDQRRESPPL